MSRYKHALPLVFALAAAIDAGNGRTEALPPGPVLEPGSLADLLGASGLPGTLGKPEAPTSRMGGKFHQAQWGNFPNFFNCFSGNWRNC
ncbi:MAG: hypothetical protein AB7F74_12955 [Parvibaculaceae bacterium]